MVLDLLDLILWTEGIQFKYITQGEKRRVRCDLCTFERIYFLRSFFPLTEVKCHVPKHDHSRAHGDPHNTTLTSCCEDKFKRGSRIIPEKPLEIS